MSDRCVVCAREPARINNHMGECSHVDCPHRRRAWSERPSAADLYRGPWKKNESADPQPLDVVVEQVAGGRA